MDMADVQKNLKSLYEYNVMLREKFVGIQSVLNELAAKSSDRAINDSRGNLKVIWAKYDRNQTTLLMMPKFLSDFGLKKNSGISSPHFYSENHTKDCVQGCVFDDNAVVWHACKESLTNSDRLIF